MSSASSRLVSAASFVTAIALPEPSVACPSCDSAIGARAIVLSDRPSAWLLAVVAPFGALQVVLGWALVRAGASDREARGSVALL